MIGTRHAGELHLGSGRRARSRKGGVITFDCGPDPVEITMTATAKIFNDTAARSSSTAAGRSRSSGGGKRRILYQNTCDQAQVWTTSHCEDQARPQLAVRTSPSSTATRPASTTRRGRRRDLRPRRPVQGRRLDVLRQPLRPRPGPTSAARRSACSSQSHGLPVYVVGSTFRGGRLLERRRAQQHRRLVDGAQQRLHRQQGDRQRRQPGRGPARRAAAAAARSTPTATRSRSRSPAP